MTKKGRLQKLELINSEGPILVAHRAGTDSFILTDEWKNPIIALSAEQFENFIVGEFSVIDSDGRSWNYSKYTEFGPSFNQIRKFLKGE